MAEKILALHGWNTLRFVVTQVATTSSYANIRVEAYADPSYTPSDYNPKHSTITFKATTNISSVDASYVYDSGTVGVSKSAHGTWTKIWTSSDIRVNFLGSNSSRSFSISFGGVYGWYYYNEEEESTGYRTETIPSGSLTFTISGRAYGTLTISTSSFTIGASETITISGAWTTGALKVSGGKNSSGQAYSKTLSSAAGNGNFYWTPTVNELAPYILNSSYATFAITWGNMTRNVNVTVPESSTKPNVSSSEVPSVSPSAPNKALNYFVQNVDAIKATITASGQYGATISKYELTVNGVTKSSTSTNILISDVQNGSGSVSYTAKVTDSRGYTNTVTKSVTYYAYSQPAISNVTLYRANADKTPNTGGEYACISMSGAISSINSQNLSTLILYYKEEGAASYSSVNFGNIGYSPSGYTGVSTSNIWKINKKYLAYIVFRDYRTEAIGTVTDIPTADVIFDVRSDGKAVSIGEYCPSASQLPEGFHVKQSWMPVTSYTGTLNNKTFTRWIMEYGPLTMSYVRYEYGDIECSNSWGNLYATSSAIALPDFGVTYTQIPMVMMGITCNFANSLWALNPINPTVTNPGGGEFCSGTRGVKRNCIVTIMAIGILNKETK